MIKTLIKTIAVASLSARIVPAVVLGVVDTAAALMIAQILVIAFLGLAPLLVTTAAIAQERKPGTVPAGLTAVTGTPPRSADREPEDFVLSTDLRSVHFDFDRAVIRPQDQKILDANIEWLKANTASAILIEGGADPRGTPEYNLRLAERRAESVRTYLLEHGIAPAQIAIVSAGDVKRACRTNDDKCWSLDRRADFLVKVVPKQAP